MHGVVEVRRVVAKRVVGVIQVGNVEIVGDLREHGVHACGVRHLPRAADVERRGHQHHLNAVATTFGQEISELPDYGRIFGVGNAGLLTKPSPTPLPVVTSEALVQRRVVFAFLAGNQDVANEFPMSHVTPARQHAIGEVETFLFVTEPPKVRVVEVRHELLPLITVALLHRAVAHLVDDQFGLVVAPMTENFVFQYLGIGGTTVHAQIVAVGMENRVKYCRIELHKSPGTAHYEDIRFYVPLVEVVPRGKRGSPRTQHLGSQQHIECHRQQQ